MSKNQKIFKLKVIYGIKSTLKELQSTLCGQNTQETEKPKKVNLDKILQRLGYLDAQNGAILTHSSILFQKVLDRDPPSFTFQKFVKIFCSCFYISYKFLDESKLLELPEYCKILGFELDMMAMLEIGLMSGVLDFEVFVPKSRFRAHLKALVELGEAYQAQNGGVRVLQAVSRPRSRRSRRRVDRAEKRGELVRKSSSTVQEC